MVRVREKEKFMNRDSTKRKEVVCDVELIRLNGVKKRKR